mmetsp:Transcript_24330/g.29714  ORF Transcript_24330/g.29714 Transcript_24330/m.29714 type:complete len:528 (-) Transcript_24330:55-1638(-)
MEIIRNILIIGLKYCVYMYVNVINAKKQAITANKFEVWVPITSPKTPTDEDLPVINGKVIDNRIAAPFSNVNEMVNNIGYLEMYFPNLSPATRRGTAVILDACRYSNKYKCNIQYALTAAHNVLDISRMNELKTDADWIDFAIRRNIENNKSKITHLFEVLTNEDEDNPDVYIYPKYNDDPSDSSGYDIALIQIKDPDNILKNMKHIPIKKINDKHTNIAKIIGYPGKYKDNIITNWLYGMTGTYTIQKKQKLIEYSDINTSMGQSGAPIFSISENKNTMNNIYDNWSNVNIIGIHTGGDSFKKYGTNINKDIIDWILSEIPADSKRTIFDHTDDEKKSHNNNNNNIHYRNKNCVNNWSNTDLIQFLTDIDDPLLKKSIKIIEDCELDGRGLLLLPKRQRKIMFIDDVLDDKIMKELLKYVNKDEANLLHYINNWETMHLPINIIDWTPNDVLIWMEYHLFSKFYDKHTIVKKNMNGKDILSLGGNVHDTASYAAIINEIKKRSSPTDLEYLNRKALSKYFISYPCK